MRTVSVVLNFLLHLAAPARDRTVWGKQRRFSTRRGRKPVFPPPAVVSAQSAPHEETAPTAPSPTLPQPARQCLHYEPLRRRRRVLGVAVAQRQQHPAFAQWPAPLALSMRRLPQMRPFATLPEFSLIVRTSRPVVLPREPDELAVAPGPNSHKPPQPGVAAGKS